MHGLIALAARCAESRNAPTTREATTIAEGLADELKLAQWDRVSLLRAASAFAQSEGGCAQDGVEVELAKAADVHPVGRAWRQRYTAAMALVLVAVLLATLRRALHNRRLLGVLVAASALAMFQYRSSLRARMTEQIRTQIEVEQGRAEPDDTLRYLAEASRRDSASTRFMLEREPLNSRLEPRRTGVSAAFSPPNCTCVIAASWDGTARVWDATTGKLNPRLEPRRTGVSVAFSPPDCSRVIAASWDGTARVWDATGSTVSHAAAVSAVAFAPASHDLVSGAVDGSLQVTRDESNPVSLPILLGVISVDRNALLMDPAFAVWLDRTSRIPGARLCDEYEWERAARSTDARVFPWGSLVSPDDANLDITCGRDLLAFGPDEVGSHPASRSPVGADDMAGNVQEWTNSVQTTGAPGLRGGSWYQGELSAGSMNCENGEPTRRSPVARTGGCSCCLLPLSFHELLPQQPDLFVGDHRSRVGLLQHPESLLKPWTIWLPIYATAGQGGCATAEEVLGMSSVQVQVSIRYKAR